MKVSLLSFALLAILTGCSSMQPAPTYGTGFDAHLCQQLRGYMGRGEDQRVQDVCVKQFGAEGCQKCMAGR